MSGALKFESFLLWCGCRFQRQKGSHKIYKKPGLIRPIIIPAYREVPVFIIKNTLRHLGMTNQQYLDSISDL